MSNASITADQAFFVKMAITAWNNVNASANKLFNDLSDEDLLKEVAPDKNSGIYLLGHLIAAADDMFRLLGLGEKLYPQLQTIFITSPDKAGLIMPTVKELRQQWKEVNEKLAQQMATLQPADWFTRHMAVSEEDFMKEPHRNRLNIIITRTNHLNYHLGQMALLKPKGE